MSKPLQTKPRLAICVATFRRPEGLARLVASLAGQALAPRALGYALELRVVDNSPEGGAAELARTLAEGLPFRLRYRHEPEPNIARARNAALELGPAEILVFVDDDEVAGPGWLEELLAAQEASGADAVFGTVERQLPEGSPSWIAAGRFFASAEPPAGALGWTQTRTGNTLLLGSWCYEDGFRFDEGFGRTGGEDVQFFSRLARSGARLWGAPAARVSEEVEARRLNLRYLLRRDYRQGQSLSRIGAATRHPLVSFAGRVARGLLGLPGVFCGRPELSARGLGDLARAWGGLRGYLSPTSSSAALYSES